jgi:DNA replication ATP-dependent helicase Dna2
VELYGQGDKLYLVLANFFCGGEEIDLAVLKRDGVVVIELKDASGKVMGGENGNWTVTNADGTRWTLNKDRSRNPFQQARAYRFAVIDQLKEDALKFLPRQKAQQMRLDHVTSVVALRPTKHPETDIQIGHLKWFSVVGLDELPQEVYFQRSPALNFRKSELRKLAQVWGLAPCQIERFVAQARSEPSLPESPDVVPVVPEREEVKPPEKAVLRPVPPRVQATADIAVEPIDPTRCIVCQYTGQECDKPYLRGAVQRVVAMDKRAGGGYLRLALQDESSSPVLLQVGPSWSDLLPLLARALNQLEEDSENRVLTVAAYHLTKAPSGGFAAGPESLIVLEPDWLINVTDLTAVEYCPRQYLNHHFTLLAPNKYLVRGNIVHQTFEQMVKTLESKEAIEKGLKQAFFHQARSMALLNHTKDSMWSQVSRPYTHLKLWLEKERPPDTASTETFVFAPQLGLKGKIDALWSDAGRPRLVGELKTGRSHGAEPRPGHRLQVSAYSLMVLARTYGQSGELPRACLFYAGNQRLQNSLNINREVALTPDLFCDVIDTRNLLVLTDYLADAPFETQHPNKCRKCTIAADCAVMAALLEHDDPRPPEFRTQLSTPDMYGRAERDWFQTYTALLAKEYRAAKINHAALWYKTPEERQEEGTAVIVANDSPVSEDDVAGEYTYFLEADNQSELREEDIVMVSDLNGPMRGRMAQGTIKQALETGLKVEFNARLEFQPKLVDRYVSESLVKRQFAGLYLWLRHPPERDVIIKKRPPRFNPNAVAPHYRPFVESRELNARQQQAVQKMLQMEDYLLIHGPPGSGKTLLILALVRELMHLNKRVLLAAGTNTAIDNALKHLVSSEFQADILRLGSPGRTDKIIRPYILREPLEALARDEDLDTYIDRLHTALTSRRIIAATATTWLSGDWDLETFPRFDVAIVDEAAQLSLPATLGPLRLADKFVLIGDHKQLPAVVLSEGNRTISEPEASDEPRLSQSLFAQLYAYLEEACPEAIVSLNEQYRMNEEICAIPRQMWYDDDLRPGTPEVAKARLAVVSPLSREHGLFPILDPDEPVVFVDVPWDRAAQAPRTNQQEALLIRDILCTYLEHGVGFSNVGVIAPFRAQVATIRRVLEEAFPESDRYIRQTVDTVDRFQGQEKELIIVSLATYGDFVHELLQDQRRLNVALTRAKHKLIVLGDVSILSIDPAYYSLIRHCIVLGPHQMESRRTPEKQRT